ncbi:MAG: 1-(5-phosphoribosyl)-5-[(5-phosphoribosylamino)methylideneamino]imidazole-4-carboxamide isomerase [Paludibacteraceae bacterium]|nr:1-(5-phosphoribosyl)-5-[(5-phosphoribosylamino)methylideneamino]imidazole-4-carboxamide isomerase [Paludibacteraceae bacterium]
MIELIPAIDIIEGKCVRLSQGDYNQKKVYNENPVEVAKEFEDAGVKRLHLVDLDGAKAKHIINHKTLESIATKTNLTIDFGGGRKTDEDLRIAFESGAAMVTGGSIAVKDPEVFTGWIKKFGAERIILGADVKDGKVAISGWIENTDIDLFDFLGKYRESGINKVICTDIKKDGMLQGPSLSLYESILQKDPETYLIASGGVSCVDDIVALEEKNVPAVIFGKAIYEGRIKLKDFERFL